MACDLPIDETLSPAAADLRVRAAIHDANQLLWVILGQARLLEREAGDGAVAAAAARIATAAADAAALLQIPLGAAPATAPATAGGNCDVLGVVHEAWQRYLAAAAGRGLPAAAFIFEAPPPPGPRAAAPATTVLRILGNLFGNAIDAMPDGGRIVCRLDTEAATIALEVRDWGPGLPDAVASEPFRERGGSAKPTGHGLGLAGCRQLARDAGGDLELVAAADPGAAFRLRLPLARSWRVLAVDDEVTVREMLAELLAAEGHAVTLASGHDEALALIAPGRFDVLLADVHLPGKSGRELAGGARRCDPALAIVLMTGWGRADELPQTTATTIDFTASKPLDLPQMQDLLQRAGTLTARRRGSS